MSHSLGAKLSGLRHKGYITDDEYLRLKKALEQPQQKTGRWIIIDDCEKFIAKCSECGRIEDSRMISKYPYCHCGAKMVESQESEVEKCI